MLIARGNNTKDGQPFLMLGLSAGNLRLLQEDKPIVRDLRPYGLEQELVIIYGETEEAIADRLRVTEKTQVKAHPEAGDHRQLAESLGLGPTGEFPDQVYSPADDPTADEGEIRMAIATDKRAGIVRLEFGTPVAWMGLRKAEALELAEKLRFQAGKLP